jgi:sulfur carrier protein
MRVIVNQQEYDLPHQSMVSDALSIIQAKPPYAVAVNLQFVPKSKHDQYPLKEDDQVEIITPVTGG